MKNYRLSLRSTFAIITALFVAVAIITLTVGAMSFRLSSTTKEHTGDLTHINLPALQSLVRLEEATFQNRVANTEFVLAKDETGMALKAKAAQEWTVKVESALRELSSSVDSPESRRLNDSLRQALAGYRASVAKLQADLKASDFDHAMIVLDTDVAKASLQLDAQLKAIGEYYFKISEEASTAATTAVDRNLRLTIVCTSISAGVILLATILVKLIAVRISRRFLVNLETLQQGSLQVQGGAKTLTNGSQSLAENASKQAASLEETSSSLTEMSSMTRRNAEGAQSAKSTANAARATADKGAAQMQTLQSAMGAIHSASNEITKILKTIDEIAFQTNILALNAAVEAARAGDAGMGFAVVAEEVRNLAQRSALAAKETAQKIENSVSKSEEGVRICSEAYQSFAAIQKQIQDLDTRVSEIASSSGEQSEGIAQISDAVQSMDGVTQSTAANAEETAAAAEELNAQAVSLNEAVSELRQLAGVEMDAAPSDIPSRIPVRGESTSAKRPSLVGPGLRQRKANAGPAREPVLFA